MSENGSRKPWRVSSSMGLGSPRVSIGPSWKSTHLEIIPGAELPSSDSAGLTPYQARDKKLKEAWSLASLNLALPWVANSFSNSSNNSEKEDWNSGRTRWRVEVTSLNMRVLSFSWAGSEGSR